MPDAGEPNQAVSLPPPRQRPWDEDVAVPLPDNAGFTDAEHWAWSKIIRGEIADMRFATGEDDGAGDQANQEIANGEGKQTLKPWPEHRKLSARFFEVVLFHEPWCSAKIKPWMRVSHALVVDEIDWSNTEIKDEFWLDQSRIQSTLNWQGTRFSGLISLEATRLELGLNADRIQAGGIFCRGGFKSIGDIRVPGAHIRGNLDLEGANLSRGLIADSTQIEGSLFCRDDFKCGGEINLLSASIVGSAEFDGAELTRGILADRVRVGGSLYCRSGFKADGAVSLRGARIGNTMQLLGTFNNRVDLSSATVTGELQFDVGGRFSPTWGKNAQLLLRNATCGALAGKVNSLKRTNDKGKSECVPTDMLGLSYARIGGLAGDGERAGATLADASVKDLVALLESDAPKKDAFSPQPYRQLADALMAAGREEKAHKIRFALLEHERAAKGVPLTRKAALFLSRHLIGHGFENWRAAIGFALVVLATAAVGLWFQGHPFVTDPAAMDFRAMGDWGGYALGNAIPLLELDPSHATFVADRFGEEAPLGLKTWLYSFKLLGFLLLSYLAAGLSGFASRSARS